MSRDLPSFTNLGSVADELAKRGNVRLRAMIHTAWRAQSCLADLRQAEDLIVVLEPEASLPIGQISQQQLITHKALMTTAVLLYARATSTSGSAGERGAIQLAENSVSKEAWEDHKAILDVRNQALAHVYTGKTLKDHDWHLDLFFAVEIRAGVWKAASATRQTGYHPATLDRLKRMLPIAIDAVKAKFHKRMEAVSNYVNDEVTMSGLRKHTFDPVATFGSYEAVHQILAGADIGEMSVWTDQP